MANFDALNPERALIYVLLKDSYDEVYGNELIVDGNMEAAGTAAWTDRAGYGSFAKVAGSPSGGTQVMRLSPTNNYYYLSQTIVPGQRVRVSADIRSNGILTPSVGQNSNGTYYFTGIPSTTWQHYSIDISSNGVGNIAVSTGAGTSGWVEVDNLSMKELRRVTKNYGRASGAPATIQLGDGFTSTSFPTQLNKIGARYDGGDYHETFITSPFERTDKFTIIALGKFTARKLADTSIFSCVNFGGINGNAGIQFGLRDASVAAGGGGAEPFFMLRDSAGGFIWKYPTTSYFRYNRSINCFAGTYDGSSVIGGLKMYFNGLEPTIASSGTSITGTIKSATSMLIGAERSGGSVISYLTNGDLFGLAVYPYVLNKQEIIEAERRMRRQVAIK